jgi:hypothetical protein
LFAHLKKAFEYDSENDVTSLADTSAATTKKAPTTKENNRKRPKSSSNRKVGAKPKKRVRSTSGSVNDLESSEESADDPEFRVKLNSSSKSKKKKSPVKKPNNNNVDDDHADDPVVVNNVVPEIKVEINEDDTLITDDQPIYMERNDQELLNQQQNVNN